MITDWYEQLPLDNITHIDQVTGGDVNQAYIVQTPEETYFLLIQPGRDESFYANEMASLKALKQAGVTVPIIHASGQINDDAFLLISFLEEGGPENQLELAKVIVQLHKYKSPNGQFGFDTPHQGSAIHFDNAWTDSWTKLFIDRRLDKLRDTLVKNGQWDNNNVTDYEAARIVMVDCLEQHHSHPVLLHGDMWGGNHMYLKDGTPALFDPASFYGDREFDIGVTTVFGAFDNLFYESYQRFLPVGSGFEFRVNFYRLYVLMVHQLKFGDIYSHAVAQTIHKITDN